MEANQEYYKAFKKLDPSGMKTVPVTTSVLSQLLDSSTMRTYIKDLIAKSAQEHLEKDEEK
jgi:hypothetical protein